MIRWPNRGRKSWRFHRLPWGNSLSGGCCSRVWRGTPLCRGLSLEKTTAIGRHFNPSAKILRPMSRMWFEAPNVHFGNPLPTRTGRIPLRGGVSCPALPSATSTGGPIPEGRDAKDERRAASPTLPERHGELIWTHGFPPAKWRNGRRSRLKIDRPKSVWVRVPPWPIRVPNPNRQQRTPDD